MNSFNPPPLIEYGTRSFRTRNSGGLNYSFPSLRSVTFPRLSNVFPSFSGQAGEWREKVDSCISQWYSCFSHGFYYQAKHKKPSLGFEFINILLLARFFTPALADGLSQKSWVTVRHLKSKTILSILVDLIMLYFVYSRYVLWFPILPASSRSPWGLFRLLNYN